MSGVWTDCYETPGAPPYWPWVQVIRSYRQNVDPDILQAQMEKGSVAIAEMVPELRRQLPDRPNPPPLADPEQARFRLFDSFTTFVKQLARQRSLVIVLDNLHWADRPSLLLLEFLGREIGGSQILVVGTYRDLEVSRQHPLSETLAELTRARLLHRISLPVPGPPGHDDGPLGRGGTAFRRGHRHERPIGSKALARSHPISLCRNAPGPQPAWRPRACRDTP